MKEPILDTPFRDSAFDFLEKGETIIWRGQPTFMDNRYLDSDKQSSWYALFLVVTTFILFIKQISIILIVAYFVLMCSIKVATFWIPKNKRNINYAITQKQIIFQFKKNWFGKNNFHVIPLSEIKDIIVVMKYDLDKMEKKHAKIYEAIPQFYQTEVAKKIGTIFLVPKYPQLVNFETIDLSSKEKRHQPTLELIEDANAVAEIIREKIRIRNTLA